MQDLPRGGGNFFLGEEACDALRSHAFARGVWGPASPKILLGIVQFGAFWSIFS